MVTLLRLPLQLLPRPLRLLEVIEALVAIQEYQTAQALDDVRRMAKTIQQATFDVESACNLLALMTRLAMRSIQLYEVDAAVDTMALRFCTSRALTELLACAAVGRNDFINRIRNAHSDILKLTEEAMTLSLRGDPQSAVVKLLADGERTLNAKIIESAHLVLQRYEARIPDHEELQKKAQAMRERYRTTDIHAGLGEQALLRLLERARIEPLGAPEKFKASFEAGSQRASFEVTTASVRNPLRLRELAEFRCPQGL